MQSPYNTQKLAWHPAVLEKLRRGEDQAPVIVQWFPTNVCNQACSFCSFGSGPESIRAKVPNPPKALWKNQQLFGSRDVMPREKMLETVACLAAMKVKCVEVSGGGEPTAYPWFDELCTEITRTGMELALVTNGTLMTPERAMLLGTLHFSWARVSIDAGTVEDYCATRNVPAAHFAKAWNAVRLLAQHRMTPEAIVGVGFVVDHSNWKGVYTACELAKEAGASSIRISASFTPDGVSRFAPEVFAAVQQQVEAAVQALQTDQFRVDALFSERVHNLEVGRQLYKHCVWKDIGCVIGADSIVYSCCSFAYNNKGVMGSIAKQSFTDMWFGEGARWRDQHDARKVCKIHCLYEARNVQALQLIADPVKTEALQATTPPPHLNFI